MKEHLERPVEVGVTPETSDDFAAEDGSPGITVTIRDGKAILIGTVRSCEERRAAEHAAWAFPDVREIDDRLVVLPIDAP